MNTLIAVLRLLHIFTGVIWVGLILFQAFYLAPAINQTGKSGYQVFNAITRLAGFQRITPIVAIITTLAGILLYGMNRWDALLSTLGGILMLIGALAGLAAFGHGFGLISVTNKFSQAVRSWISAGQPEAGAEYTEVQQLGDRYARNARVAAMIMIVAVIGMASARGFTSIVF